MKVILKTILAIIVIAVIVVIGSAVYVVVMMKDATDDTPTALYTEDVTKEAILSEAMTSAFDLSEKNTVDLTFANDELNELIYAIVKDSINASYNPSKEDATDDEKYIYSYNLFGTKKLAVKSVYASIEGEQLNITACLDLGVFPSTITLGLTFSEDSDNYIIQIQDFKLGKFNATKGIDKKIVDIILKNTNLADKTSGNIKLDDLTIAVNYTTFTLSITKDDLASYASKLLTSSDSSVEKDETLVAIVDMLTSKENDIINLGVIDDKFGLQFDLNKATVEESMLTIDASVQTFNEELFILNKTQGFVISNIGTADPKIVLTDSDLNSIIYARSTGYSSFSTTMTIPNTVSTITISVIGIIISFTEVDSVVKMNIRVIVNLNGLKTSIELAGIVSNNNTDSVTVKLDDSLTIGKGLTPETEDAIIASSELVMVILDDNIDSLEIMDYDKANNAFTLNASSFNEMFSVSGTTSLPLSVNRLKIVKGKLEVYVTITDTSVSSAISSVSGAISSVLEGTDLTTIFTDTTDEAISEATTALNNASSALENGDLTEEEASALVDAINNLSAENQSALLNEIQGQLSDSSELEGLYDSLFGK